jgi:hypothetical protein
MKTRTLLLLSLACALAIVAAGVALTVRVTRGPEAAPPAANGVPVPVGDMTTVVHGASAGSDGITVRLAVGGVEDADAADDFVLLVAGTAHRVANGDCDPVTTETRTCELSFAATVEPGTSTVLTQARGEDQVRWVLVVE